MTRVNLHIGAPLTRRDPLRIAGYRVLRRLGRGGMGTVYLAQRFDDRLVAIKVVRSDLVDDSLFLRRFRREMSAARRVPAFCTARLLDADADADPPYLVTEFVKGPTLDEAVRERGPLGPFDQQRLAVGVAAALTAIHKAKVVHRDLKPSNVLLSSLGPRVIDFGIARALDATTTLSGHLVGTPAFMAPEQYMAADVEEPADVFAWGAVVAFASAGEPPFGSGASSSVMYHILNGEPDLWALDDELRVLVRQAMNKDPDARPTSRELLDSLIELTGRTEGGHPSPTTAVLDRATETVPSFMPRTGSHTASRMSHVAAPQLDFRQTSRQVERRHRARPAPRRPYGNPNEGPHGAKRRRLQLSSPDDVSFRQLDNASELDASLRRTSVVMFIFPLLVALLAAIAGGW